MLLRFAFICLNICYTLSPEFVNVHLFSIEITHF